MKTAVLMVDEIDSAVPEPVRPPLKWVGGKRWQIQHLLKHWQPNKTKRLVEPFAGGLAVALGPAEIGGR